MISFLLGKYLGMERMYHFVAAYLTVKETIKLK